MNSSAIEVSVDLDLAQRVTIVVITRDRVDELLVTVNRLSCLEAPFDIVVVDNASSDGTGDDLRRRFPHVNYIRASRNLGAAARNVGVAAASTEFVAFADDDLWWEAGSLRRAVRTLDAYPEIALVCGRIVLEPSGTDDPVCQAMAESPLAAGPLPGARVLGFIAGASVVRAAAFGAAGGFREQFGVGGEEDLLAWDLAAAGWVLVYDDRVVARHQPSASRNPRERRRRETRNALWTAWLRLPLGDVLRVTGHELRRAVRDPDRLHGVEDALRAMRRILADRRPVPPNLARELRLVFNSPSAGQRCLDPSRAEGDQ